MRLSVEPLVADAQQRPADPDKALKRYAEDIGVNYATLQNYRTTAVRPPAEKRLALLYRHRPNDDRAHDQGQRRHRVGGR